MKSADLTPVIEHRQHLEDEAQRAVAQVRAELQRVDDAIEAANGALVELRALRRREITEGISPPRLGLLGQWGEELHRRRENLGRRRVRVERAVHEAKTRLLAAHRELRKCELLQERLLREERARLDKLEQKMIEEMTVMRSGHPRS
ncbi:flagellar export protein FliJ [Candidatus Sumerlaeota bacterium]|nr:flagellar export protein FliJ [Candidatus Sumerlaeota bacterium]